MPKFTLKASIFERDDKNGKWSMIYSDEFLRNNIGRKIKLHKENSLTKRFATILSETKLITLDLQPKNPYSKIPGTDLYQHDQQGVHTIKGQWPFYTLNGRQPVFIQVSGAFSTSRIADIVADLAEVRRKAWRDKKRTQIAKSKLYRAKITAKDDKWRWAVHKIGRGGKLMRWGLSDDQGSAVERANTWLHTYNNLARRFPDEFG